MRGEAPKPVLHRLESVYPNPFNGAAILRFSTAGGSVDLAVYDALGQRLRTLARGERAAGTYSVRWDGLDAEGRPAASGTYLVRLQVGGTVQSRSLVLLQ